MLRAYRSLLYLYPAVCRDEFRDEMVYVFSCAQADLRSRDRMFALTSFYAPELSSLLTAAAKARFCSLFGFNYWVPFRTFDMRSGYKFPRSTVLLMFVILAGVLMAINKAKDVVQMKKGFPT